MSTIDRYTCEDVLRRLDDYLDRQLSAREMELARTHIEACAACAQEYGFSVSTLSTIKTKLRRIDVAPDLIDRISLVLAEAHAEEEGSREYLLAAKGRAHRLEKCRREQGHRCIERAH